MSQPSFQKRQPRCLLSGEPRSGDGIKHCRPAKTGAKLSQGEENMHTSTGDVPLREIFEELVRTRGYEAVDRWARARGVTMDEVWAFADGIDGLHGRTSFLRLASPQDNCHHSAHL
jgi:hypothetical protein